MVLKKRPLVLVIDDDPGIANTISHALSKCGYQLVVLFNVEDALVHFDHSDCALVIVDIFMEGMGGIEGIKNIRKLQPDTYIIAISGGYAGISSGDTLSAAKQIGADAVMAKPINMSELRETVSGFVKS